MNLNISLKQYDEVLYIEKTIIHESSKDTKKLGVNYLMSKDKAG